MPPLVRQHDRVASLRRHPVLLGLLGRLLEDFLLDSTPPIVLLRQLGRDRPRTLLVTRREQLHRLSRVLHPPRRIEPRRQLEPDVDRIDVRPAKPRSINERPQPQKTLLMLPRRFTIPSHAPTAAH